MSFLSLRVYNYVGTCDLKKMWKKYEFAEQDCPLPKPNMDLETIQDTQK